nr:MAG TPA: hypothetical protein [Microviridae sp.]
MKRTRMKPKTDRKVFRSTAVKTKKINIDPLPYRGGTRL